MTVERKVVQTLTEGSLGRDINIKLGCFAVMQALCVLLKLGPGFFVR
jgi:hypothetical protein